VTAVRTWTEARREFEDLYMDHARATHAWQIVAFLLLGLLGVVTVVAARLALGERVTPYIVEVDKLGRAQAFGPAEAVRRTDTRLVVSQIALFLRNVRTVLPSEAAEADVLSRAYAFVDPGAAGFLNTYFTDVRNNPRVLGRSEARTVEVTSVLAVPGSGAWRVQWTETEWPLDGSAARASAWEGYLGVRLAAPQTVDAIEENPLGVHVTSIAWTRVGGAA
jgi:type IV secretion system protein TrbF